MNYTIKQVAELTDLSTYTLRYYEKEGLLHFVGRNSTGRRVFTEDDLEWLGMIRCLKSTGMSIKQIKQFVDLSKEGDGTLKDRYTMLIEHRQQVLDDIQTMKKHLKKVEHKIDCIAGQMNACQAIK